MYFVVQLGAPCQADKCGKGQLGQEIPAIGILLFIDSNIALHPKRMDLANKDGMEGSKRWTNPQAIKPRLMRSLEVEKAQISISEPAPGRS